MASERRTLWMRSFRLLDLTFHLESASTAGLDSLDAIYRAPEFDANHEAPGIRARLGFDEAEPGGPWAEGDWGRSALPEGEDRGLQVHDWLFDRLRESSSSFLLIHAAALAFRRRGLLVAGLPFAGKTTLAVALAGLGLEYYSDDVAPLSRQDGRLHPFRRAAGVRHPGGRREYFLPVPVSPAGSITSAPPPCEVRFVFLLEPGRAPEAGWASRPSIRPLSREGAALELLRHTLNRATGTTLYRQYGAHPHLKAYGEIYAALAGARSFLLTPGTPETTAGIIHQMVMEDDASPSRPDPSRPALDPRA